MIDFTTTLNQKASYWPPVGNDATGGKTFRNVVTIDCRWQDDAVLFRDQQGRESVSDAIVYTEYAVQPGGMLLLGELAGVAIDANPVARGAMTIRRVGASPSLQDDQTIRKAYL